MSDEQNIEAQNAEAQPEAQAQLPPEFAYIVEAFSIAFEDYLGPRTPPLTGNQRMQLYKDAVWALKTFTRMQMMSYGCPNNWHKCSDGSCVPDPRLCDGG